MRFSYCFLEWVFELLNRFDRSCDRETGGFGLGLVIVQNAILLHSGQIIVTNATFGGAKFTARIPSRGSPLH